MSSFLLAANWKMSADLAQLNELLPRFVTASDEMSKIEWLICPSYPYLSSANEMLQQTKVFLGAQDVSEHAAGAYTSQVSAAMLSDSGVTHVLLGHSECRHILKQGNESITLKFKLALAAQITPILCVGETLAQRQAGEATAVVEQQLAAVLTAVDAASLPELLIAYEPVWAIGTGETASSADVAQMHANINAAVAAHSDALATRTRILYGGSVKKSNASELVAVDGVDGFLVGGASLTNEFIEIGEICNKYY